MALYPEIAAELRRLVAQAYQADTVQGGLVHQVVEGLAVKADTGDWPADVEVGVSWALDMARKIQAFCKNKGISDSNLLDISDNYKGAAVRVLGIMAEAEPPPLEYFGPYIAPIISARGGPGASHRNMLLAYTRDNIHAVWSSSAP